MVDFAVWFNSMESVLPWLPLDKGNGTRLDMNFNDFYFSYSF